MAARSSITHHSKGRRKYPPIVWIGGDKGGVGKSFIARILAAWLRLHGHVVIGFDGDARNAHLERYYKASMTVERPYLRREQGWSMLYAGWEAAPQDAVILIDLPGNIGDLVEREMDRIQRIAEALQRDLIHVWVCDEEADSITLLKRVRHLADLDKTLVAMNGRFAANAREFELWLESDLRAELLADGGRETYVPMLPIRARTKIARARAPFDNVAGAQLQRWEFVDFKMWWERVETAFTPFAALLEARS